MTPIKELQTNHVLVAEKKIAKTPTSATIFLINCTTNVGFSFYHNRTSTAAQVAIRRSNTTVAQAYKIAQTAARGENRRQPQSEFVQP